MRSFGECVWLSGSASLAVGMPRRASAATIGSVPPARTTSGSCPKTPAKASRASRSAAVAREHGRGRQVGLDLERRAVGEGVAQDLLRGRGEHLGSWPGATRIVTPADAADTSVVLRRPGFPPRMPVTSSEGSTNART